MSDSTPAQRPRVAVIGLGAWGSSLALYCARIGHQVIGWHIDESYLESIRRSKQITINPTCTQPLHEGLTLTSRLEDCRDVDFTIVALPGSAWSEVLPRLQPTSVVISATKGLERTLNVTPLTYAHSQLQISPSDLCVISGPSFAKDLALQTPISLVCASSDRDTATKVATMLSSNTLRCYISPDTLGVELGGILKNVIAIAVGISDALSYGPSTRAALITRGLAEMTRIAVALGANSQTLHGLSGLGDLVMTATDDQSRNRMVGLRLGKGEKLSEIIASLGSTAEGASSAELVLNLATKHAIEAPIVALVVSILRGEIKPQDLAQKLMSRPLREEF
jgi:glycerol-3-phosphate dehydrogenase (NAD(P)+)